ncbi:MAG TPA: hypothetical protein VJW20_09580 [Candidatus Angelobacter sp.]|nr:hypothetical protein [Candidatus Angelobacter sp.]
MKRLRKVAQTALVVVALIVVSIPGHLEFEFVEHVCHVSLWGCIAAWTVIVPLVALGLWAWITDIIEKRKKRKLKKELSGETITS